MRFSLVLAALLCFTTWMSVGHATNGLVASCCLGWSNLKGVPLNRILDYTIQSDGVCRITAVVFKTIRGRTICSDPNSDRVKKAILKVDEEKKKKEALQEQGQTEEGLTSDITPTVSTTAVAFQTTRGVRIYSDPNSEEKAILKVDEEKKEVLQEKGQNEEGLTSDITPAVCTKPKKKHHRRKADMEGDTRGRSPGQGGRGKENVREESQDKSKLPQSANFTLSIWTSPAILHE